MQLHRLRLLTLFLFSLITFPKQAISAELETTFVDEFNTTEFFDTSWSSAVADTVHGVVRMPGYTASFVGGVATPGSAQDIAVSGGVAYVADFGQGIRLLNVSDPAAPTLLGSLDTPGSAWEIVVRGGKAYVADATSGLRVIDVSNPASPIELGAINTPGSVTGIRVAGRYAFAADGSAGIQVIDIANPAAMTIVGTIDTPGEAISIDLDGNLAYVADRGSGLTVVDISSPTAPTIVGNLDTPGDTWGIDVAGNVAYLGDAGRGLHVVDISTPSTPVLMTSLDPGGSWRRLEAAGDYLYAATYGEVRILDISNPAQPSQLQSLSIVGIATSVEVHGEHLFVAAGNLGGIQVLQIAEPIEPGVRSSLNLSGAEAVVEVRGDVAFTLADRRELHAIDISDPANPSLISTYLPAPGDGHGRDLAIEGNLAYAAHNAGGLSIIDVSSPSSMFEVGHYNAVQVSAVAVDGDFAYVNIASAVHIVNVTDPTTPVLVSSFPGGSGARGLEIDGDRLYIANPLAGLQIVDVGDPLNPTLLGSYASSGQAIQVSVDGNFAYLADSIDDLVVLDVSDPANPFQVASWSTGSSSPLSLRHSDDVLAVFMGATLKLFDVRTPSTPIEIASLALPPANDFAVGEILGDNLFTVDQAYGMRIIPVRQRSVGASGALMDSRLIRDSSTPVVLLRFRAVQTELVEWGGYPGTFYQLPGEWLVFQHPEFRYRAILQWTDPLNPPTVDRIEIDLRYEVPVIEHVRDVANDQGGQVRVTWTRSGYDDPLSSTAITGYTLYREIDPQLGAGRRATEWDYLMTIPARGSDTYSAVVPTLADSTVTSGPYESRFFVSAMTTSPAVHFDSPVEAGYSLDNLVPGAPGSFAVTYGTGAGNSLGWLAPSDPDMCCFRVYRGFTPDFEVEGATPVAETSSTQWQDPEHDSATVFYKVAAVDDAGNEGPAVSAVTATANPEHRPPPVTSLHGNVPNPFNPRTTIAYTVASETLVRLEIFDSAGRRLRTLVHEVQPARRHEVAWDGRDARGESVASGTYFYRLQAGQFKETRKMVLIK